jgi:hypothetical protein
MDTWIHGYMDTWIHGYMDTSIHRYIDTWIHGYMDTWIVVASHHERQKNLPTPSGRRGDINICQES